MANYLGVSDVAQSFLVEYTNGTHDTEKLNDCELAKIGEHIGLNVFGVPKELEEAQIAKISEEGKVLYFKENNIKEFQRQFPSKGPAV